MEQSIPETNSTHINMTKVKEFTQKINKIILSSYISLGLALGSSLELFQVMSDLNKPASSQQIADAADCKERYVREWLYLMTAAEIVEINESGEELFYLPHENRPGVMDPAQGSLILWSIKSTTLASTFDPLLKCFKKNGPLGVSSEQGQFLHHWEKRRTIKSMSQYRDQLVEQVPGLKPQLERGINVMDIGGGNGSLVMAFAQLFPNSTFHSCDIRQKAIDEGTAEAQNLSLTNVHFHLVNGEDFPEDWTQKFDYVIMLDVLHDLPFPLKGVKDANRILKPNCFLSVVDNLIDSDPRVAVKTENGFCFYTYSLFHCLSDSLTVEGSAGLGTAAGNQKLTSILQEGGFQNVKLKKVLNNSHLLCTKLE